MIISDQRILSTAPDVEGKEVNWSQLRDELTVAGVEVRRWSGGGQENEIAYIGDSIIEPHTDDIEIIVQCIRDHIPLPEE